MYNRNITILIFEVTKLSDEIHKQPIMSPASVPVFIMHTNQILPVPDSLRK